MMDLNQIINEIGGQARVAKEAGVTRQAVSRWVRQGRIPADRVIPICRATKWRFTPHRIRPDIYPNPLDGLPPEYPRARKE